MIEIMIEMEITEVKIIIIEANPLVELIMTGIIGGKKEATARVARC